MASFEINRNQVPLWTGGNGKPVLKTTVPNGNIPLTPGANPILDTSFDLEGGTDIAFGGTGTVQIGISSNSSVKLTSLWKISSPARPIL